MPYAFIMLSSTFAFVIKDKWGYYLMSFALLILRSANNDVCKSVLIRPSLFQRFPDRGRGEGEGHRGRGWAHNCNRSQGVLARRQPELRSVKNGLVHRLGRRIKTHFNRGKGQSIENNARERCNICCTKSTSNNYILVNFSPKNSVIVIRRFFHYSVNK